MSYQQHPLSTTFPAMTDAAFAELRADIAANGLLQPIALFDNQVLDGWHRYKCCSETGVEARFYEFEGNAIAARKFVIASNLIRRHLDTSQRAMIAGRMAQLEHGTNQHTRGERNSALIGEAADLLNVSKDSVKDAREVLANGDAETIARVEQGELPVSRAAKEVRENTPKRTRTKRSTLPLVPDPAPLAIEPLTVNQWRKLPLDIQRAYLTHADPTASLNAQKSGEDDNLIDWARFTWNPVTGCEHNCPYCYARDIAERFANSPTFPNGFVPTLRAERLSAPLNTRPRDTGDQRDGRIFTCSMADLFGRWVPGEWIEAVLDVAARAPAWEFLMLTKFPKRMSEFKIPDNVWMGTTVDCQARVANAEAAFESVQARVRWLSCEPMIEPLRFRHLDRFDLLVIGGASASNSTPRWIPPFSWLDELMRQADDAGCSVFCKSNIYRKEAPGGQRYRFTDRAPAVFDYLRAVPAQEHVG